MPLIFTTIWGVISNGFGALVTFCSKPPGSYLAIVGALIVGLWWYGQHEFNAGEAACNAAHKAAAQTEVVRQVQVDTAVTAKSEAATTVAVAQDKSNRTKVIYVKAKAADLPPPPVACPDPVPADLADSLRALH